MSEGHVLRAEGLACGYGDGSVITGLDFELGSGSVACLLGPNGVGKTTLFKTLLGFLKPLAGRVLFDGEDTAAWSRRRYGQAMGYIPQAHAPSFPFTVLEVVLMGRTPHVRGMGSVGAADEELALAALADLGMEEFAGRDYTALSGGERQMVLVARVLAQDPAFLVMDEPTSALDLDNQARVLECVRGLARRGYGVLMTTHDPNQALLLDGDVMCLRRDGGVLRGRAGEVLDARVLGELYGREVQVGSIGGAGHETVMCAPVLR